MTSNVSSQIVANSNNSTLAKAQNKTSSTTSESSNSVSSDAFLQLMVMQLQYQDPMNPMDNSEMLAQEAQFVTLEQMEKLASSFSEFSTIYQANSLIGQTVEITNGKGETIKGTVDFVDYSDASGASVNVDGTNYPLSNVTKVYPQDTSASDAEAEEDKNFFKEILSYGAYNIGYIADKISSFLGGDSSSGGSDSDSAAGGEDTNTNN